MQTPQQNRLEPGQTWCNFGMFDIVYHYQLQYTISDDWYQTINTKCLERFNFEPLMACQTVGYIDLEIGTIQSHNIPINNLVPYTMNNHHPKSSFSLSLFPETVPMLHMPPLPIQNYDSQAILEAATVSTSDGGTGIDPDSPFFNAAKFYQQFKRIYFIAFSLHQQKTHLFSNIQNLHDKIIAIEKKIERQGTQRKGQKQSDHQIQNISEDSPNKRFRRISGKIEKKHTCFVAQCKRQYGSDSSLQQHIKLKHPQLRKESSDDAGSSSNSDNDSLSV